MTQYPPTPTHSYQKIHSRDKEDSQRNKVITYQVSQEGKYLPEIPFELADESRTFSL